MDCIIYRLVIEGDKVWYLVEYNTFLKIEFYLCFEFDLREALDIRDFLKETRSTLKLRFDCSTMALRKSIILKIQFKSVSKVDWFNFTLINFSVNI